MNIDKALSFTFYWTQVNLGSDLWVRMSVRTSVQDLWLDLTDVTLADEDTNLIMNDNANWAIQGNEAMQVMQAGDQCKFATFAANSNCAE